jgi:HAD superfamily hydrolase (TIGR01549 family)
MTMQPKLNPRAVFFDLGSTLIEYESVSWGELSERCALRARARLVRDGYDLPGEAEFLELFEAAKAPLRERAATTCEEWTVPEACAALFRDLRLQNDDGLVDRFFTAFYAPVDEMLYVYDDTVETLQKIRERFETVGLISNTVFPESVHIRELKRFGLNGFFDFKIFSSTFGLRKPHPDIFNKAANLAGAAPGECVYVGDRYLEDIEGPSGVGMPAILRVKPDREYPPEMPLATRRIATLAELNEHFDF